MTGRLTACPFCGKAELHVGPYEDGLGFMPLVHCRTCDADTLWDEHCDTRQEASDLAVALWDRRALAPEIEKVLSGVVEGIAKSIIAAALSQLFPPAAAKPSTCCPGEHLVPMHSTDTKLCTGCKTEKHWPLEPGQKRTY